MIVDKIHVILYFRQSMLFEDNINLKTQKRTLSKNDFEKEFYKLLINAFYGKTMEYVRNRVKIEFIRKVDKEKKITQQSNMSFNGIPKNHTNFDSNTFKQMKFFWINQFI